MIRARALAPQLCLLACAATGDQARILLPPDLAGQVVLGERGSVEVEARPARGGVLVTVSERVLALGPTPAYPFVGAADCPDRDSLDAEGFRELPAELAGTMRRAGTTYDVVLAVVAFVSERIVLDDGDRGPQDAHSVLDRGRARCSGRANLAVGLLRVLGVPARVVHGILVGESGGRWHRWGEAWLGGDRWLPFDPGASVGLVRVRYLPVRSTPEVQTPVQARLVSASEGGFNSLPRWRGLRIMPTEGATLHCFAGADSAVQVELTGPDGLSRQAAGGPPLVFEGLLPGRYTVRAADPAGPGRSFALTISGPGDVRINVAVPEGSGS